MRNKWAGNAFIYLIIFVAVIAIFWALFPSGDTQEELDLTDVLIMAKSGQVSKIVVDGDKLIVTPRSGGREFIATKEAGTSVFELLASEENQPFGRGLEDRGPYLRRHGEHLRRASPVSAADLLRCHPASL